MYTRVPPLGLSLIRARVGLRGIWAQIQFAPLSTDKSDDDNGMTDEGRAGSGPSPWKG